MPKIKGCRAIVWHTVVKILQRKIQLTLFELKWLTDVKDKSFSLFALCASDNLFFILLQLGTFNANYTLSHKS